MKSQSSWEFAHRYCGKVLFLSGTISLPVYALLHIPFANADEGTLIALSLTVMLVQCVTLVLSIIPTESALKKNFTDEGERKEN
jgi:hypothetical protein